MNCPMDIIAKNIDSRVIGHALGTTRVPVHKFFNENIKGKGNTYKYKKLLRLLKPIIILLDISKHIKTI